MRKRKVNKKGKQEKKKKVNKKGEERNVKQEDEKEGSKKKGKMKCRTDEKRSLKKTWQAEDPRHGPCGSRAIKIVEDGYSGHRLMPIDVPRV